MTPDLERAVAAMLAEDEDEVGSSSYTHLLRSALRALLDPSPEVLEAMAKCIPDGTYDWRIENAKKIWRAGLTAILGKEPSP